VLWHDANKKVAFEYNTDKSLVNFAPLAGGKMLLRSQHTLPPTPQIDITDFIFVCNVKLMVHL